MSVIYCPPDHPRFVMLGKWRRKHRVGGKAEMPLGVPHRLWRHMCVCLKPTRGGAE